MNHLTDAGSSSLVAGLVAGLADLASPRDALARVLERIVVTLGFDHAEMWEPFGTGVGLGLTMNFPIGSTRYRRLSDAGRRLTQLRGFGLAGLTAESGETTWVADLAADERFLRGEEAEACGLTSVVAFPVSTGDEVLAVILLFSASEIPAGSRLARALVEVGDRLAPIVKHGRAIERYEQLMDLSPVPVVVHSEGVVRYANRAMADLLGASDRSDLVGRPIVDFIPESNRAEVSERVTTVLSAISPPDFGADFFVESTWTNLAGERIQVEVVGTPTTFEDRPAIQVMARDVTDRNRARSALRVSERRYRQIVEGANDGICLVDQLGVVSYCNEPMAAMLGYERDEIAGRPARTGLGDLAALVEVHEPVHAEVEFTRRDGSSGWAVVTVSPVDEPESDDRILLTALDVTANRMAQRQLRFQASILDQVQNAVIATDDEGHIVYWNAAAGQMYGWEADEVMGERVLRVVVPESSKAATLEVVDEAREKGGWSGELELKRKDGLEFSAHVNGVPVTDAAGEPSGFVVVTTDVSEQKAAQAKLEMLLKSKDEFIASVSHELRTPLTAVLGFAEILEDPHSLVGSEEKAELLRSLVDQARDVSHIVEDLLVAARADSQQLTISKAPTSLSEEVSRVLQHLGSGQHDIVVDIPDTLEVYADAGRLRQIIRNLVSNALRHGGNQIRVQATRFDGFVLLDVRDDGEAIPPEEGDRIFEPYTSLKRRVGLTNSVGLGLTVSQQLARLMGGDLFYERASGWTIFRLELPASMPSTTL